MWRLPGERGQGGTTEHREEETCQFLASLNTDGVLKNRWALTVVLKKGCPVERPRRSWGRSRMGQWRVALWADVPAQRQRRMWRIWEITRRWPIHTGAWTFGFWLRHTHPRRPVGQLCGEDSRAPGLASTRMWHLRLALLRCVSTEHADELNMQICHIGNKWTRGATSIIRLSHAATPAPQSAPHLPSLSLNILTPRASSFQWLRLSIQAQ